MRWVTGTRKRTCARCFRCRKPRSRSQRCVGAIKSLADLDGKKVGAGPAKGPAEVFFRAAAEIAQVRPIIVNGDPAVLTKLVAAGEIGALWQVSAWNFVVANKDLADQTAYAITKAVLSAADPTSEIYPTAAGTLAGNAAYTGSCRSIQARCYSTPKPGSGSPRREA